MVEIPQTKLQEMDPYRLEELVAKIWELEGYQTTVSQGSRDRGIDIEAVKDTPFDQKVLIQVKRYAEGNKIGSDEVRNYATLYQQVPDTDTVIIVTTSSFTSEAQRLARDLRVKMVDGESLENLYHKHTENLDEFRMSGGESSIYEIAKGMASAYQQGGTIQFTWESNSLRAGKTEEGLKALLNRPRRSEKVILYKQIKREVDGFDYQIKIKRLGNEQIRALENQLDSFLERNHTLETNPGSAEINIHPDRERHHAILDDMRLVLDLVELFSSDIENIKDIKYPLSYRDS